MTSLGIVNPKKRREIEGVGGQSLVDLKATLFKAEDEAKRAKASGLPVPSKVHALPACMLLAANSKLGRTAPAATRRALCRARARRTELRSAARGHSWW